MRRRPPKLVHLSTDERQVLQDQLRHGRTEQRVVRRCRILLAMAEPNTIIDELARQVGVTRTGIWYMCRRFEAQGLGSIYDEPRSGRPREVSALERVAIEQLACCDPAGLGLNLTHWSTRSLARVARERQIRPQIAHSTVSLILRDADLQPHRSRYWITPTLDAAFVERASRVLWCYEQVDRLAARDEVVLALDEKPNLQALERTARQWTGPGRIRRQEFEYVRHGTVNFLVALVVHSGQMHGWCLDRNDSEHLRQVLPEILKPYRKSRRIHLIWDGGPSHTAEETLTLLHTYRPQVRVVFTPAHASWLNQAELLLRSFEAHYLRQGSWNSRRELIEHLCNSAPEYNRLFAHPIQWSWTRRNLRDWVADQVPGLC
jgi:transposase